MTHFVIEHPRYGVYLQHESVARFSWKRAVSNGKRFDTRAEAEKYLAEHLHDKDGRKAVVVEKTHPFNPKNESST